MRAHRFIGLLVLGAAMSAAGPDVSWADTLNPPLVGMSVHSDEGGVVSIELPVTWRPVTDGKEASEKGHLVTWSGWYQQKNAQTPNPDQFIYVHYAPAYRHAELLHHYDTNVPGRVLEGSLKRGDGWVQVTSQDDEQKSCFTIRWISAPDCVIRLTAKNYIGFQEHIQDHTEAVFSTFKVTGEVPDHPLPDKYKAVHGDGVEIWTNGQSSRAMKNAVLGYKQGWSLAKQLSDGDRAAHVAPRMVFCKDLATYRELFADSYFTDRVPPYGFPDRDRWAVVMLLADSKKRDFPDWARRYGALQYLRRHYGGMLPPWVEWGISLRPQIELHKKGKLGKPHRDEVKRARKAVLARKATLDQVMDYTSSEISSGLEDTPYELWAWHYYLSTVAVGELAGSAYGEYLEILRETGNVEAAEKAFDGIGTDTVTAQFHSWVDGWK